MSSMWFLVTSPVTQTPHSPTVERKLWMFFISSSVLLGLSAFIFHSNFSHNNGFKPTFTPLRPKHCSSQFHTFSYPFTVKWRPSLRINTSMGVSVGQLVSSMYLPTHDITYQIQSIYLEPSPVLLLPLRLFSALTHPNLVGLSRFNSQKPCRSDRVSPLWR
ncbi:hypothetical protein B0T13DRAFT_151259 [Neurospora crassa]|nr:hypothetical protein B0T13DRAFT_151259 [Neurospora crassa]